MNNRKKEMPSDRWEGFSAYANGDGTFHVLVVSGDGGYIFADRFNDKAAAEWTAEVLNAALKARR